jgi:hypothetical protein
VDLPAKGTEAPVAGPPAGGEDFVVVAEDPLGLAVEQRLVDLGLVRDGNPPAGRHRAGQRRQDQHQGDGRQLQLALSDLRSNEAPRAASTDLSNTQMTGGCSAQA